ncbi:MAG: hypothetical protein Q9194_004301 [Teloschistes cf. exilis]
MQTAKVWTSYPTGLKTPCLLGEDRDYYHCRLAEDSPRLFKTEFEQLDVICGSSDSSAAHESLRIEALDTVWTSINAYTWDQFAINLEALQMILTFHQVFAPFLDCVHSFGIKTSEADESWNGYRRSIRVEAERQCASYEFCYTLRYVIRNKRSSGPAWSVRRTAVYQQYQFEKRISKWILLQPPANSQRRLSEAQAQKKNGEEEHPMRDQVVLLYSTATFWGEYIMDLRKDLEKLNDKACFSKVGKPGSDHYATTFADSQRTQNIRQRLLRTLTFLDAGLEIAKGCVTHCRELELFEGNTSSQAVFSELEAYSSQMQSHRSMVSNLLEHSRGTMELLFKILEYRNSESFSRGATALHKDVELLRDVALQSKQESKVMTKLAEQNRSDTRSLKSLSVLGTLYLPVTFLATIFSSNLIELRPIGDAQKDSHLALASDFWLFVVVAVPLIVLTLSYTYWLERRRV